MLLSRVKKQIKIGRPRAIVKPYSVKGLENSGPPLYIH